MILDKASLIVCILTKQNFIAFKLLTNESAFI